ncbi:hypothetical protein P0082_02195 [Candidatus Haliotispira prima]|uniref:Uncharacterized protein n=1 Tax=Candidatus Haliotispira prima TaxID=3034016 RepID=A0ABY8MI68_9SPIO|nr:hypothetical protein P0082_02195 [Candidatus Haliotispira prima]
MLADEYRLFALRKKGAKNGLPSCIRIYKVSQWRLLERIIASVFLTVIYFFRNYSYVEKLYIGAYIGFVTNALVTVLILHVFIPKLKRSIAKTAKDSISDLVKLDEEDNAIPNTSAAALAIIGVLLPGGLVTTLVGSTLGLFTRNKVKSAIEEKKRKELENAKAQIEEGINKMSKQQISNMMDEMIGTILILIESAGFLTGAFFGLLVTYL